MSVSRGRFALASCAAALLAAMASACAARTIPDENAPIAVSSRGRFAEANALPYQRLIGGAGENDGALVADVAAWRARETPTETMAAEPATSPPPPASVGRAMIRQREAWWMHAPQFIAPRLMRAAPFARDARLPREALGRSTVVRVHLDEDGEPARLVVVESVTPELDELCVEALSRSEFSPARWADAPLRFTVLVPCFWRSAPDARTTAPEKR